ncbi:MAG: UbiA family prenyltransferase [Candidatus Saccharibacteria bacterium]
MRAIKRLFSAMEDMPLSFRSGFFAFLGIVVIKAILENFANGSIGGFFTADFDSLLHYLIWFSGSYLSLVLVVYWVSGQDLKKITRFLLALHVLIWITALIDLVAFRGEGHKLSYIYLGVSDLLRNLVTVGLHYGGVGLGQMIIIPLFVLIIALYVYLKTGRLIRALFAGVFSYLMIFAWGAFPSLFKFGYDLLHGHPAFAEASRSVSTFFILSGENSILSFSLPQPQTLLLGTRLQEVVQTGLFSQLFFVAAAVVFGLWAYSMNKERFRLVVGNIRFFGIIHYYLNLLIGLLLATKSPLLNLNWTTWLSGLVLFFSYYAAYMYALGVNDIEDLAIDRVSNSERPLARGRLTEEGLSDFNFGFLVLALTGSYLAGPVVFYAVLVALMASYIYSAPPLRLKRVPFLSTFLIALASLSAVIAGFYFLNFSKAITSLPTVFVFVILIFHVLWGSVKDLKDREGDRADGILTVANLFPERASAWAVAVLAAAGYLAVPLILGVPALVLVSIAAALLSVYLILTSRRSHYPLFLVYYLYTGAVMVILSLAMR